MENTDEKSILHVSGETASEATNQVHPCKLCNCVWATAGLLEKHIRTKHTDTVQNEDATYACDMCGFATISSSSLKRHKTWKHGGTRLTYDCDMCDFGSKHISSLYRHKRAKHKNVFVSISPKLSNLKNQPIESISINTSSNDGGETDIKQEIPEEDPLRPDLSEGLTDSKPPLKIEDLEPLYGDDGVDIDIKQEIIMEYPLQPKRSDGLTDSKRPLNNEDLEPLYEDAGVDTEIKQEILMENPLQPEQSVGVTKCDEEMERAE